MKSIKTLILIALFGVGLTGSAIAQDVTYQTDPINEISFTGSPSLVVNSATAGSAPDPATDATATYDITTNESNKKITAAISTAPPTGVTLSLDMAAPAGATSSGSLALGTTAADMVTGISTLEETGLTMTYTLEATTDAGVVASTTETVTFTIADGV